MREENAAFIEFSRHFRGHGLPVPEIYGEDLSQGAYLEEDLGDTTLFEFLSDNRDGANISAPVVQAYRKVVEVLPRFQVEAGRDLNYKKCYPRGSFDRQSITWDLNYFKYYFLRLAGIPFNEQALEDDFSRLTKFLLSAGRDYFLYRDFQSRNIMLRDGQSILCGLSRWTQRRAAVRHRFPSCTMPRLLCRRNCASNCSITTSTALAGFIDLDREAFMQYYYAYVYVRIMQALGAYGFRGFYERKAHFLQSVPYALNNVRWLLHNVKLAVELPTLIEAFTSMVGPRNCRAWRHRRRTLTVRIFSFSFHQGLPKDDSGNGGGFVFDARSIPNPGRRGTVQASHGQGCAGDRLSQPAGERASVSRQRHVAGGCQRERVSAPRLQDT